MRIQPILLSIAAALLTSGCASHTTRGEAQFMAEDFYGLRLSLVHETAIEIYRLGSNGIAFAQLGTKNGPITGPAVQWKFDQGYLVFGDGRGVEKRHYYVIAKSETRLKVRRPDDKEVVFAISKIDG